MRVMLKTSRLTGFSSSKVDRDTVGSNTSIIDCRHSNQVVPIFLNDRSVCHILTLWTLVDDPSVHMYRIYNSYTYCTYCTYSTYCTLYVHAVGGPTYSYRYKCTIDHVHCMYSIIYMYMYMYVCTYK